MTNMPRTVAQQFSKSILSIEPLGNGYINDTYLVATDSKPFVLQKINKHVFPRPEQITTNLLLLNKHISQINIQQIALTIPHLLVTENGNYFFCDAQDDYWRALSYIDNTESLENISNLEQAGQVGLALAQFHRLTHGLDATKLHDTLPGFHITPGYLQHYQHVKSRSTVTEDPYCKDFILDYQHIVDDLETAKAQGLLVEQIIHGDPKLNNFLFDKDTNCIISLIDLDTVKPGLIHYDIGDCLRSCCHNTETDEFDLGTSKILLTNYLNEMGGLFSGYDFQFLYPAIRLIPFELGLRFYTDYLDGNRYFKVNDTSENLRRATAQFRLCSSVMAQEIGIISIIEQLQFQKGR
jgi:Ser/Thr protein kinase RdoA (MazF antagonist)